ncbi:MAG: patatin-like phospholipase family protein, partial [Chlamydiia bacterium]|nr:patatin-like phospholipase family protein [Chlamydiia bacterium]
AGIHPDLIIGCSAGAIIGALYADQPHVKRLETLLIGMKRSDLMDFSLFSSRFGVVKGGRLQTFLKKTLKARTFSELQIPMIAVATDLLTGELIELGGGELVPAICASSAVPGVFNPVQYLGRFLIDGGVADPIPVQVAKKYGAQMIIAVDIGQELSGKEPLHLLGVAKRGLEISYRKFSEVVSQSADVVIRMEFQYVGMFSDRYNKEIYEHGRLMARKIVPHIEQIIADRLAVHEINPG